MNSPFAHIKPARNTPYSQGCMRIIRNRLARIERYVVNGRSSVRRDQEFNSMLKLIRKAWPKDARIIDEELRKIDARAAQSAAYYRMKQGRKAA